MDSVYQDTVCIQPIIIATQHQSRLIEIVQADRDADGNIMDFGDGNEQTQSRTAIQGVNY